MDALTQEQAYELLRTEMVGHLGVIDDERPYVSPISYVTDGQTIGFRTGRGRRLDALAINSAASFEVSRFDPETGDWDSVIVAGDVERVTDDATIQRIIGGLLRKYGDLVAATMGHPMPDVEDVVLRMSIDEISGRSSGSYFLVRTRPGRL